MPANVLPFHPHVLEGHIEIPTPVYYRPGDKYVHINITDDRHAIAGLYRGATAIILLGLIFDGQQHLLERKGELCILHMTRMEGDRLRLGISPHKITVVSRSDVDILGCLVELYPLGLSGPRIVLYQPERARRVFHSPLPIYNAYADQTS